MENEYLEKEILRMMDKNIPAFKQRETLHISKERWKAVMTPYCEQRNIPCTYYDVMASIRRPKVEALYKQGLSCNDIARALGVGNATVYADIRGLIPEEDREKRTGAVTKAEIDTFIREHPIGSSLDVIYDYITDTGHHVRKRYNTTVTGIYKHFCTTALGVNPRWAAVVVMNRGTN